jgi:precorrin-2/cobalt-factor-2 C20-methyltransferase
VKQGILYGISVGTGDPELITVKGLGLLQRVSVVAFPAGIGGKSGMAESIIAPWLKPEQTKLALDFPYTQDEQQLLRAWKKAAQGVWSHLEQGRDVAFACEGDAGFYSTFNYLAQTLQQFYPQVQIEIVPGVCSPMAAASVLGIPLTVGSERLAVLPALYSLEDLEKVLSWAEVVVLMKVSSVYQQVWKVLEKHQLLERAAVVERATLPDQLVYQNLSDRPFLSLSYFSILIISNTSRTILINNK